MAGTDETESKGGDERGAGPEGRVRKPRAVAAGFLLAFAASIWTLIYTGLSARGPAEDAVETPVSVENTDAVSPAEGPAERARGRSERPTDGARARADETDAPDDALPDPSEPTDEEAPDPAGRGR